MEGNGLGGPGEGTASLVISDQSASISITCYQAIHVIEYEALSSSEDRHGEAVLPFSNCRANV